jgi:hypothetical protein
MQSENATVVQSDSLSDFKSLMTLESSDARATAHSKPRLNLDQEKVKNGLAQLVLTIIKLLHELLERQAIRRMEAGSLTDEQIDQLGCTLMRQAEEIERIRLQFGLEEKDLNLELGPLGKLV